jgi:hypothetical protein
MNIPTAEEIAIKNFMDMESGFSFDHSLHKLQKKFITNAMIEFAKLHVEAALKEASISKSLCTLYTSDGLDYKENRLCKESVENAYSLDNIK